CVHRPGIDGRGLAGVQPGARRRSDKHLPGLPAAGFGRLLPGGDFARMVATFSEAFASDLFAVRLPQVDGHRIGTRATRRRSDLGGRARIVDSDAYGSGDGTPRIVGIRTRRTMGEEDRQAEADRLRLAARLHYTFNRSYFY